MEKYYYRIEKGRRIFTNMTPDIARETSGLADSFLRKRIETLGRECLLTVFEKDDMRILLLATDKDLTRRKFLDYAEVFSLAIGIFGEKTGEAIAEEEGRMRRYKHNIKDFASNIGLEFYRIFPQDELSRTREQQRFIEERLRNKPKEAAKAFMRIHKNAKMMTAEFDAYESLNSSNFHPDKDTHSLHKIVTLALQPHWLDFREKKIWVEVEPTDDTFEVDYRTFMVAMSHIFNNALKYTLPDSALGISFYKEDDSVEIYFDMMSMRVGDDEVEIIFRESYSGNTPTLAGKNGNGIGMYLAKEMIRLNGGSIAFRNHYRPGREVRDGIVYENNQIVITLPIGGKQ